MTQTGTGSSNFQAGDGQLYADGVHAPAGEDIISASFVYGALGTCQGGSLKLAKQPDVVARRARWRFRLGDEYVHAGIVDQVNEAPGDLFDVPLIAPHRQHLDAYGAPSTSNAEGLRVFGLAMTEPQPHERLVDVLGRVMDVYPTAEYGIGPDLFAAVGLPEMATPVDLPIDDNVDTVKPMGYSFPNYVTDALFDPGEGWPKYTYHRDTPDHVLRRSATATADPAIITKQDTTIQAVRDTTPVAPVVTEGVTHSFNNIIEADNVERTYAEVDSTATAILSDVGVWKFTTPADTQERRNRKVRIRCPFMMAKMAPYPSFARVIFENIQGVINLIPGGSGSSIIVGGGSGATLNSTLSGLSNTATLDEVRAKVQEQIDFMNGTLKTTLNQTASTVSAAVLDITQLAQRVNELSSNTVDAQGNLTNIAQEVQKIADKLNSLGTQTRDFNQTMVSPRGTPKRGDIKLLVSLYLNGEVVSTQSHAMKETDAGLELAFTFEVDKIEAGVACEVRYEMIEQDTGRSITITFRPIEVTVDYDTPNVEGVKMPDGWTTPFEVGPIYQFRVKGWHVPPLRITGLPGGVSQMAAGSVVTWHRGEASTLITTQSWPYAGQRRG